ncbi:MAG: transglycosylase SLT domain-containing protein [Spirochaetaceae bacterium]|jgi:hypothetical protein|nr:transglycosylase SLT domain-containing protein [Spirochaetaceae bacterium]
MVRDQTRLIEYQKQILLGIFFVAVIFLGGKILVEKFMRISVSIDAKTMEETSILIQTPGISPVEPQQFHSTAVKLAKQPDRGLLLYRAEEARDDVVWFYTHITGNQNITLLILEYASRNDIPPSLAFSLAWEESRYQPRAVNHNAASIDRGLFQLNNKSFPYLTEREFFDPEISARYGLQHLSFCLETAGNEVSALAMYNAGTTKVRNNNTPYRTLDYVSRILAYREGLDDLFETEVAGRYRIEPEAGSVAAVALLN